MLIELQRSELLSLDKFLHLPVSLSSAFMINYVGSISSAGDFIFFPLMIGLSIGLVFSKGAVMLLLFPLIAAFALMVTALTHQFRGWLASLMVNQRRRRTVISVATLAFILIVQMPSILNFTSDRWSNRPGTERQPGIAEETENWIVPWRREKSHPRNTAGRVRASARNQPGRGLAVRMEIADIANRIVPLGWLPYGAAAAFEGRPRARTAGDSGPDADRGRKPRRSYRTTMRLYTGHFNAAAPSSRSKAAVPSKQPRIEARRTVMSSGNTRFRLSGETVAEACPNRPRL